MEMIRAKLGDYLQLVKARLSFVVVFSASMAYLWASNKMVNPQIIWLLSVGGFCITAASNVFNQIWEKNTDKLMARTASRPLPCNRVSTMEALVFGGLCTLVGLACLFFINSLSAVLGAAAMLCYVFAYTPMKRVSSFNIIPGAIAGSLPVVIGCTAATGTITHSALLLFIIQFVWQFPHTWSIAWMLDEDYNKAGIKMLPPMGGLNKAMAILLLVSTFLIIPAGLLLYMYNLAGVMVSSLFTIAGLWVTYIAYKHYNTGTRKSALRLMLGLVAYLPFILLILVLERFF